MMRSTLAAASLAIASAVTLRSSPDATDFAELRTSLSSFAQIAAAVGSEATQASSLTPEQKKQFEIAFDAMDSNGDGIVTKAEVQSSFSKLWKLTPE